MAEQPTSSELQQKEKTVRCAEFTLSQTPFMVSNYPDVSFGTRFIDGIKETNGLLEVPGVSEGVSKTIKELILQHGMDGWTEERISEQRKEYHRQIMHMGEDLREKAQNTASLISINTEDATSHFGQLLEPNLLSAKTYGWAGYKYQEIIPIKRLLHLRRSKGQEAVQTHERSVIIIPQKESDENDQLDIIDLDKINQQDPGFVKDFVLNLCRLQILENSFGNIIGLVRDNYSYHEQDERSILPELLQELSLDPQTAAKEGNDLLAFLRIHSQTVPTYETEAKRVIDEYPKSDNASRNISLYLNHINSCKTESEAKKQRASVLQQVHNLMSRPVAYFQREGEALINDKDRFKSDVDLILGSSNYLNIVTEHVREVTESRRHSGASENEVKRQEDHLRYFEGEKIKFGELLTKIGLSQEQYEEIGKIIILPRKDEEDFIDWRFRWDDTTLREVLFAKYLSSMSVVDIQSGFFRRLIKRIFPSFDERAWEIIDKTVEQPSKLPRVAEVNFNRNLMPGLEY